MQEATINSIVELRSAVTKVFGEGSFVEHLERRGFSKTRVCTVVDTDWTQDGNELVAAHWTTDPEPVIEKFFFPPTWSNKESWKNIFDTDYPECAADGLDIALWTPRTPHRIIMEDANGIRTIKAIDTDPVMRVEEKKLITKRPVKKPKPRDTTRPLFGENNAY